MIDGLQEYIDKRTKEAGNEGLTLDQLNGVIAEFMEGYNNRPIGVFEGYSPTEMNLILHGLFTLNCPVKIANFSTEDCAEVPLFRQVKLLLRIIEKEGAVKLTQKGNLPVRIVKEIYEAGASEPFIEQGIVKLRGEEDSQSVEMSRIAVELMRATKKRNNVISLTKLGTRLLADDCELMRSILAVMFNEFNQAFLDYYPSPNTGSLGVGFTLVLLDKYGGELRSDRFYADKYLAAFPMLLEECDSRYGADDSFGDDAAEIYSHRTFDIFLRHLGLVQIEAPDKYRSSGDWSVSRSKIFSRLFSINRPNDLSKVK